MFEEIKDVRIVHIEDKNDPLTGRSYHHVNIYYSDNTTLFYDGWVDESLIPIFAKRPRKEGIIPEDVAYPLPSISLPNEETSADIVLAGPNNKSELMDLCFQAYFDGDTGPVDALAATKMKIDDEHQVCFMRLNNKPIAMVYFYDGASYGHPETVYIETLFVHPTFRNKGIEKVLVNNVANLAIKNGYKGISTMIVGSEDNAKKQAAILEEIGFNAELDDNGDFIIYNVGEGIIRFMMFGYFKD